MTSSNFEWGSELPTLTGRRLDLRALAMQDAQALLRRPCSEYLAIQR